MEQHKALPRVIYYLRGDSLVEQLYFSIVFERVHAIAVA